MLQKINRNTELCVVYLFHRGGQARNVLRGPYMAAFVRSINRGVDRHNWMLYHHFRDPKILFYSLTNTDLM